MIEFMHVTKTFDGRVALQDVSFQVQRRRVTGLIGPNGSGKTTAMRLICALLRPDCGEVLLDRKNVTKDPDATRRRLGVLFGGDVSLYDQLSAEENLLYFGRLQAIPEAELQTRIAELVELLGMQAYCKARTGGYSRGMRQKVAFARSIIHCPEVMLLDEPSSGLDLCAIRDVQQFIRSRAGDGCTILLSSHNMHELELLCEDAIFLNNGRVIAAGHIPQLLQSKRVKSLEAAFFAYI